jgi:tetratricopeptide (TPR) repeat protein
VHVNENDLVTSAIITTLTGSHHPPAAEAAYEALKTALRQKFGPGSEVYEAIEKLEKRPDSTGRQAVVSEEINATGANRDSVLIALAQTLLEQTAPQPASRERLAGGNIPLQRPPQPGPLVGREAELTQLLADLQPGQVIALCGPEGLGKSALAAAAIWRLAPSDAPPPRFPDGVIYYNFCHQPRVDIALEHIARTLGRLPQPTPYDAVQQALINRQALLLLDSVEQADDLTGLLSIRGNCGVLMTSRSTHEAIPIAHPLSPLPPAEATALLQRWFIRQDVSPIAPRLNELVGGLPLALYLTGQYLTAQSETPQQYLDWLTSTPLAAMEPAQRREACLPWLLERTLSQANELAQQTLAVCGWLALHPFEAEVILKALTIKPEQGLFASVRRLFKTETETKTLNVYPALEELVKYGLLREVGAGYQIAHPAIYDYARQQLIPPTRTVRRLAAYYTALAWDQTAQGRAGYPRLDQERPHLMQVLNDCVALQDWEAAYGLAAAIEDYLDRQNYGAERVIANEVGLMAAWQLDRPSEGDWMGNLGDTYRSMGHARWAIEHFEKALATARQTGDRPAEANSLGNLGLAYRDLGQIERARQYLEQALVIFDKIHSPSAEFVREWLVELDGK